MQRDLGNSDTLLVRALYPRLVISSRSLVRSGPKERPRYHQLVRGRNPASSSEGRVAILEPNASRIRTVTSGQVIWPTTPEEKLKAGHKDFNGDPKLAKIDLSPEDRVIVVKLELFETKHRCDLCGAEKKSKRVVLLRNERTGKEFYAAGVCLGIHFARSIDDFEKGSGLWVRTLNGLLQRFGIVLSEEDTEPAVASIIPELERIEAFSCKATRQARELLEKALKNPSLVAVGEFDEELKWLQGFVQLQDDYRLDPDRFRDRWRAMRGHPLGWSDAGGTGWDSRLFSSASELDSNLGLDEFGALMRSLEVARAYEVPLNNTNVEPWSYETRDDYLTGLRSHYELKCGPPRKKPRFHVLRQRELGEDLVRASESKRPSVFSLEAIAFGESQLSNVRLANQDTVEVRGARIVYGPRPRLVDIGKTERVYLLGAAVYYPDRWSPVYALWYRYGRDALERIDDSIFAVRREVVTQAPDSDLELERALVAAMDGDASTNPNGSGADTSDLIPVQTLGEEEAQRLFDQELAVLSSRVRSPIVDDELEDARVIIARVVLARHSGDESAISEAVAELDAFEERLSLRGLIFEGSLVVVQQKAAETQSIVGRHLRPVRVEGGEPYKKWRIRVGQEHLDDSIQRVLQDSGWIWE